MGNKSKSVVASEASSTATKKRRRGSSPEGKALAFGERRGGVSLSMKNKTWFALSERAEASGLSMSAFVEEVLVEPYLRGELVSKNGKSDSEKKKKLADLEKRKAALDAEMAALKQ